jgi:L-alanine-DL-glutamate epimerase-like enolase superfamily enzyme
MSQSRITRIEWATFEGKRPRPAGCNARLGEHGSIVRVPITRITTGDGASGFGFGHCDESRAQQLAGQPINALFEPERGVPDAWRFAEYPIWDLAGKLQNAPVYKLAAAVNGRGCPADLSVPCYDTSLYIDDLHLKDDREAAELIAEEAAEGYAKGHRAFKIKVGRGARHMPLQEGTLRDIAVIHAVRGTVGGSCMLMIDANNGYNLNIAKHVLLETRECSLFWLEEAFHEDATLYRDLKTWLQEQTLATMIADGEGEASANLLNWAKDGLIDVVQYDVFGYGFTRWLETGRKLDGDGVRSAPHHYGAHYGNYASCHLAPAICGFMFTEWDEADTPGLDTSSYTLREGLVAVPNAPGFGIVLDENVFQRAIRANGGRAER